MVESLKLRYGSVVKAFFLTGLAGFVLNYLMDNAGIMMVCSGICLFLFAMLLLEQSFKLLSGGILEKFLNRVADKNWKSFSFGFVLSTLVQSSGLVTVIAVSFLSAGMISLAAGVAMVYGVNLSAACTTWIVGYFGLKAKISLYAMPFIILGVVLYINKNSKIKGCGLFLLSLGLLFLGISWMKDGFEEFKDTINVLKNITPGLGGLLFCTLIGLIVTCFTQSSHATITLAITALTVGQISYWAAIGVSIGAAVGSTFFTIIGSFNANVEGRKIAASHVIFKLICAAFAIVFIDQYLALTDWIAVHIGIANDDMVYKLAIFMSLFNLLGVVLLTPFISQMCSLLNKLMRSRNTDSNIDHPKYLNKGSLEYAESAIETLKLETDHLLTNSLEIVARMICIRPEDINSDVPAHELVPQSIHFDEENFEALYQRKFKFLYSEIIDYAVRASSSQGMNAELMIVLTDIRRACIIMAAAVKKAQQLHINIVKYGSSDNEYLREEYAHIRRNLVRLVRLVNQLRLAKTAQAIGNIKQQLLEHKHKFDVISSSSLDSLIRNRRISDVIATSIMNDNATSRSISKNLNHVAQILTKSQDGID